MISNKDFGILDRQTKRLELEGILCLLFGTISWGLIWYPYRLLNELGISGLYSSLFSFTFTILIALFVYKLNNFLFFKQKFFWIYAIIGGVTNIAYVLAVINGELVRVMLLFFLSPVWTIPFSYFFLKEKIYLKNLLAAFLSLLGAFIILWHKDLFVTSLSISDIYALIAGIGFALGNVMARNFSMLTVKEKSYGIWIGVVFLALVTILIFPQNMNTSIFEINILFLFIALGLTLLITTMVIQYGLVLVEALRASPIFLFEIVVAGISAYFLANEILSFKDFIGGVFVVMGVLISTRK